jgi:hypothetical protein
LAAGRAADRRAQFRACCRSWRGTGRQRCRDARTFLRSWRLREAGFQDPENKFIVLLVVSQFFNYLASGLVFLFKAFLVFLGFVLFDDQLDKVLKNIKTDKIIVKSILEDFLVFFETYDMFVFLHSGDHLVNFFRFRFPLRRFELHVFQFV